MYIKIFWQEAFSFLPPHPNWKTKLKDKLLHINDIEKLTKINMITGTFKYYVLNGFYEKQETKSCEITLGQDITDYLFDWEKKYLEERNK